MKESRNFVRVPRARCTRGFFSKARWHGSAFYLWQPFFTPRVAGHVEMLLAGLIARFRYSNLYAL